MIAEAAVSIPLRCDDERTTRLLRQPSAEQSGRSLLERLYIDLQITGNAWAEAVTLIEGEGPRAIYGLRADAVRVMTGSHGRVTGFALRTRQGERIIGRGVDGWLPALHLKLCNPDDANYGLSPLLAARKALDMHTGASTWAKALLDNAARPSGALVYGKDGARMSDEQFDRLKRELVDQHAGSANAGRPLLLEGGLDWKPMSLSPAEMDFHETRNSAAREIALAFGVPPMLLGIPGDNTYATYKEANTAFWRLTVLPLVVSVADAIAIWLSGPFEGVSIEPDLDDVPAFAADREAIWQRVSSAEFLTDQEKRELLGLNPRNGQTNLRSIEGGT